MPNKVNKITVLSLRSLANQDSFTSNPSFAAKASAMSLAKTASFTSLASSTILISVPFKPLVMVLNRAPVASSS